jgi:hypothetical protein
MSLSLTIIPGGEDTTQWLADREILPLSRQDEVDDHAASLKATCREI